MTTDASLLPAYVQAALPNTCIYCGATLSINQVASFYTTKEELIKGESPYHCCIVEFHCVCRAAVVRNYVDWQRTEYP